MSYTTFLLVEDGSADAEELISDLKERNLEIKVIVYRQGAQPPILVHIDGTPAGLTYYKEAPNG